MKLLKTELSKKTAKVSQTPERKRRFLIVKMEERIAPKCHYNYRNHGYVGKCCFA